MLMSMPALAQVHAPAPLPPGIYDSEKDADARPMRASEAAAGFRAPPGFRVDVFAAEPEVLNPIALSWGPDGRLWVAENFTYSERELKFDLKLFDRVIVFEDNDGDGRPDRRVVFTDQVQRLTSVETGRGGAWLMCPPELLFLPDRDGDLAPDGPPQVVLDGFTVPAENYHNFANGLKWGPDGWLYGRCGASAPGEVGAPGTAADARVPLRGGLWRYHPDRKVFEALTHGTTNPWGHDWDARGEAFFINTVNGHLWHAVAGMHFVRPHTLDPNPHVYELIDQHADHWHWDISKDWTDSRKPTAEHSSRGGGHAHSGMMIYQADQWPEFWRGKLLTLNFHGRRANVERLERFGSGFVGKHEPDAFFAADPFFRGIDLSAGPDGSVFVLDWSDTGECHESTGVHRRSGRIFRITHGDPKPRPAPQLGNASLEDLAAMQNRADAWWSRMARRVLVDRVIDASHHGYAPTVPALLALRKDIAGDDPVRSLNALWTLHGTRQIDDGFLRECLRHPDESVRAWSIRLLADAWPLDMVDGRRPRPEPPINRAAIDQFVQLAANDPSGLVRLVLASTLQRLPVSDRPALASALMTHGDDANDHNLPLLVWYGLAPVADADPSSLARLAAETTWPKVRRLIARRLAEDVETKPAGIVALVRAASASGQAGVGADVADGMAQGLRGWRKATRPEGWDDLSKRLALHPDATTRTTARDLDLVFGDGRALEAIRAIALDAKAPLPDRASALRALITARPGDLRATCEKLLDVRFLNAVAVRGLALADDPALGRKIAKSYRAFHPSDRPGVIDVLASRQAFATAMLDEMAAGGIPRGDVTAFQARQVVNLGDESLTERLGSVWGRLRDPSADRASRIASWKARLDGPTLARADLSNGRAVFQKTCASCHALYGRGGNLGPDLTGANRDNIDYLLQNVLDPSATVTADYRVTVLQLDDGRVLSGLIKARTDRTVTLQTVNEALTIETATIEGEKLTDQSIMPDGQLDPMTSDQVRDLVAYLMARTQVALPPGVPEEIPPASTAPAGP
jgi:putative membrane-bound dehydrogenase-like protein